MTTENKPYTLISTLMASADQFIAYVRDGNGKATNVNLRRGTGKYSEKFDKLRTLFTTDRVKEALEILTFNPSAGYEKFRRERPDSPLTLVNGRAFWEGVAIADNLNDMLIERFAQESGSVPSSYFHFVHKVYESGQYRIANQLYNFMRYNGIGISENGNLVGWKAIDSDGMDKWTHKISYAVGRVVTMPRIQVNDDPTVACASGLHVGSYEYAMSYGSYNDIIALFEVDPRDVVSVPHDHDGQKLRACKIYVVDHVGRLGIDLMPVETVSVDFDNVTERENDDMLDGVDVASNPFDEVYQTEMELSFDEDDHEDDHEDDYEDDYEDDDDYDWDYEDDDYDSDWMMTVFDDDI